MFLPGDCPRRRFLANQARRAKMRLEPLVTIKVSKSSDSEDERYFDVCRAEDPSESVSPREIIFRWSYSNGFGVLYCDFSQPYF